MAIEFDEKWEVFTSKKEKSAVFNFWVPGIHANSADVTLAGWPRPVQWRGSERAAAARAMRTAHLAGIKRAGPRPRRGGRGHALAPPSGRWRGALRGRAPGPPPRSPAADRAGRGRRGAAPSAVGCAAEPAARRSPPARGGQLGGARPLFSMRAFSACGCGGGSPSATGQGAGRPRRDRGWGQLDPTADLCALSGGPPRCVGVRG